MHAACHVGERKIIYRRETGVLAATFLEAKGISHYAISESDSSIRTSPGGQHQRMRAFALLLRTDPSAASTALRRAWVCAGAGVRVVRWILGPAGGTLGLDSGQLDASAQASCHVGSRILGSAWASVSFQSRVLEISGRMLRGRAIESATSAWSGRRGPRRLPLP